MLKKRDDFEHGHATRADLQQVEDEAIKNIVEVQRKVGIKSITDGELLGRSRCYRRLLTPSAKASSAVTCSLTDFSQFLLLLHLHQS